MRIYTFAAILCGFTLAAANAADFAGKYTFSRGGYSQEADIALAADGAYKVEVYAGTDGCSGAFEGVGNIEGANLVARTTEKDDACRLVFSRTRAGVRIDEDNCLNWHGASCDFNGTLRRH
jgi:hypothetical protein